MGSTFFSKRYNPEGARVRSKRPKSFDSREKALEYAKQNQLANAVVRKLSYNSKKYILHADKPALPVPEDKA